jgi:hypothetical protein
MRLKKGFILRDVCGDKVICAEELGSVNFGKMLVANETTAALWQYAVKQGDFTIESLVAALCEEYDADEAVAQKDVTALLGKWRSYDMIED